MDRHPLADHHLRIPSTHRTEIEESLVIDVADQKADLVGVPGKHQLRPAAPVQHGDRVSHHVGRDTLRQGLDLPPEECLNGPLIP